MTDLPVLPPDFRLIALDSIGSTNAEAARHACEGAPDGTLVWARTQTAGRGRQGRGWTSPPGNLYCSLLLRPACPPAAAAQLGFVAGLALGAAAASVLPAAADVRLKWPNDVLVNGAKVAGILLESGARAGGALDWLVIGTGLNITEAPAGVSYRASCLAAEGAGREATPARLLEVYAGTFVGWHRRWREDGFGPIRTAWLALAAGFGEPIRVRLASETLEGRFAALDDDGALRLALAGGEERPITAGDVFAIGI